MIDLLGAALITLGGGMVSAAPLRALRPRYRREIAHGLQQLYRPDPNVPPDMLELLGRLP